MCRVVLHFVTEDASLQMGEIVSAGQRVVKLAYCALASFPLAMGPKKEIKLIKIKV